MIPKRIHYVWVGGPLPESKGRLIAGWRDHNPDYEFVRWNEDNIDFSIPILRRAYHERRWSKVADIVRLMAVHAQGGIYLDTDFQIRKPLNSLLGNAAFWSFQVDWHPTDWVCNGVFGAEPGHWFLKEALDEVLAMRPVPFGLERPTRTGPKLVTRLLRKHGLHAYDCAGVYVRDMLVLPWTVFFPVGMGQEFSESYIKPETLGVHMWDKSWAKDLPKMVRWALYAKSRLSAVG